MRKQTQQPSASLARRTRLEEPFAGFSQGGAMRCYQTGEPAVAAPPASAASQPVGQGGSPQVSPGAAQPQAAPGMVQIPLSVFEGLNIDPKDLGNIRHRLKHYDQSSRDGWLNFIEQARANQLSGNQLAAHLEGAGWSLDQPQGPQEPPAGQGGWPGQQPIGAQPGQPGQVPYGYDPQGLPYPYDPMNPAGLYQPGQVSLSPELQQLFQQQQEVVQALQKQVQDLTGQYQTDREQATEAEKKRELEAAFGLEDQMLHQVLEGMGHKRSPSKQNFLGREQELDLQYDVVLEPILRDIAHRAYSATIVPGEGAEEKFMGPIPPEFVKSAGEAFGPILTLIQQQGAQAVSSSQEALPTGSVPAGPGGREQKQVSEMNRTEAAEEAFRQAEAAGVKLRGNYGE